MPSEFGRELYATTNKDIKITEEEAIVQSIQNICFIKPGTYPNDPDLGLGIEEEQFELIDNAYITKLEERLNYQIDKYIITDYVVETRVTFKYLDIITSQKVLIIEIFVGKDKMNLSQIDLLFNRVQETNKLKFYIMR